MKAIVKERFGPPDVLRLVDTADVVVESVEVTGVVARVTVALVGGRIVTGALGHAYAGSVGDEVGRLVVYLAPWMVAHASSPRLRAARGTRPRPSIRWC